MNTATIWRTALERLGTTPIDAVSLAWMQDAHLESITQNDDLDPEQEQVAYYLLQVASDRARDLLNAHWRHTLEEILADILSQPVSLAIQSPNSPAAPDEQVEVDEMSLEQEPDSELFQHAPAPPIGYQQSYSYQARAPKNTTASDFAYKNDPLEEWENEQRANILVHNRLNQRYTFDAFIVGNSNRLAHAASLAVAEAPGESYNPLFLYGGVGLGKTHLLHAIGHQGVQTGLAVLYVSSEQFTNEIVNAIRYRTTEEFRAKYRSVDILLVDDIQFIAGKESTEEEFFHTFNSLYEMSKQIVICSDRPPKAIVSLEERLRSRFEWGLIADIQPPDLETRMAILRVKADLLHYHVPDEIIAYVAGRVQTNIRELEGCLNRLMAYQQLHRVELTMDVARAAMSSLGNDTRETRLDTRQIAQTVAEYYQVSLDAMCGKQRDKHIVVPRQIAMYLIRQETQASLLEIGQLFGGRDHSTVLHACEKIDRAINTNPSLRREVIAIREQLMHE
ncbi:MAG: chromosomal replication initiator protein DnaA [Ktedonobacteraceae bacterium]|nr:chromosomal replication initiator protein DnaA [Ktedonobacteraceae bacterium]